MAEVGDEFRGITSTIHFVETTATSGGERFFELVWGIQNAVAEGKEPPELDLKEFRDEFRLA